MSTRSWSTGIVASSLATLAAWSPAPLPSAPSGGRCAASLALCSARWLIRNCDASRPGRRRIGRRPEGDRIVLGRASAARSRATSSSAATRSLFCRPCRLRHGRIELDQDVAGLDASARRGRGSRARRRSRTAGSAWCARPARSCRCAVATMSTLPNDAQASATQKTRDDASPRSRGRSATAASR